MSQTHSEDFSRKWTPNTAAFWKRIGITSDDSGPGRSNRGYPKTRRSKRSV